MNLLAFGNNNQETSQSSDALLPSPGNTSRYHGMDALRGVAMLLGIVLHASLPYMPNVQAFWPTDESSSYAINAVFQFIHVWRMPLFFILAGFFANLVISRKSWKYWWGNRLLRLALPLIVFSPLMSLTLPWIFKYGTTGEFGFFYSDEDQPFHLWFLWQLIIFVLLTVLARPAYLLGVNGVNSLSTVGLGYLGTGLHKLRSMFSGILFRSRFPIVFVIICSIINLPTGGELIINPVGSGLYFILGYSLYKNPLLLTFLKVHWKYYFLLGVIVFILVMVLNVVLDYRNLADIYSNQLPAQTEKESEFLWLLQYLSKIICGVLFSYAFIGFAEKRFGTYDRRLRFISDGSYWMYLIHLPVVTLITFAMFKWSIPIEIKFLISVVMTSIICGVTYKYLVRSTPIGFFLNGKRQPFKLIGL